VRVPHDLLRHCCEQNEASVAATCRVLVQGGQWSI
jgi:hypothetical protein